MGRKKKAVLRQLAAARAARWHKRKNTTPPPPNDLHLEVCESAHCDDEIEILAPPPPRTGPAETDLCERDGGGISASREAALNELPPTSQESTEPTAYEKISMSFEAGKETWKRAEKKRGLGGYTGRAESTRRHRRAQARQRAVEDERLRQTKGAEIMRQFVLAGRAQATVSARIQLSAASRTPLATSADDEPGPPLAQ
ncbi:hypothetical protein FISHEDRAFT_74249 [Fistulina hepatica ATCC 64428]|uniref:Uncharacterized protein n=1 Tax=Fistulina hepatica ATCC 64428 TaxID=1128425 RepID=A0A0D7ADF3_9AGAR|nr:hypothetical protein FISHEDRAFT_74249 [Fistulina hepatica ATCC 64428]